MQLPSSLYIHIPYCRNICDYCSFTVSRGNMVPDEYIQALKRDWQREILKFKEQPVLKTIYLGGGTPSLLNNSQIYELLTFFKKWAYTKSTEITIEANPTSLLENKIEAWVNAGVNRVSVGVQSLNDKTLKQLTRTHSSKLAKKSICLLKNFSLTSFNVDLIFGVYTQSINEFQDDLLFLLDQKPPHLSAYELTIEEGTPFYTKKQSCADENETALMMELLDLETKKAGIYKYEISNYAMDGHQSQHNKVYWKNQPYFGIGCGAFSYYERNRYSKETDPNKYIYNTLHNISNIVFSEQLAPLDFARETFVVGMRMVDGINFDDFKTYTGFDLLAILGPKIYEFQTQGFVEITKQDIKFTATGIAVANTILANFV